MKGGSDAVRVSHSVTTGSSMEALVSLLGPQAHAADSAVGEVAPGEERTQRPDDPRQARRREIETEIRALKGELELAQDYVHQNRARLRRGELARRDAEITILKTAVAELVQEEKAFVKMLHQQAPLSRVEQVAQRVDGYLEEIQDELGIGVDSLTREVPETLRFCEKGDGSFESITTMTCNMDPSAKTREFVGSCPLYTLAVVSARCIRA